MSSPSPAFTPSPSFQLPKSILIIGSGVFGLSTAWSLAKRKEFEESSITVVDKSVFPAPDGSSIDTSRIIRPDYADPAYAALAAKAHKTWRQQGRHDLGGEGRYSESGLALVANNNSNGLLYVRSSYENVIALNKGTTNEGTVYELPTDLKISQSVNTGGHNGGWGYLNTRSGWADAKASMIWLRKQVEATKRVAFLTATVASLVYSSSSAVEGVKLDENTTLIADLTILATGAWTPSLVDLRGRCQATGQVLAYLDITPTEQAQLSKMPVFLNMSSGMFIIPPSRNILKVARHGYGYSNPVAIPNPSHPSETITVSCPFTKLDDSSLWIPQEGEQACRKALSEMIPSLKDRPFTHTKICWYTDTPTGDFLITYHPSHPNLFLATGGSGHGFKFLPVIGDKIVDCVKGECPEEFREKWAWPKVGFEKVVTEDGTRGGRPGMIFKEELGKGSKL